MLLMPQDCLFLRIAYCWHVNAPRIAFAPLPWYYPLSQIKTPCSANLSVKAVHTQGKNALPLATWHKKTRSKAGLLGLLGLRVIDARMLC